MKWLRQKLRNWMFDDDVQVDNMKLSSCRENDCIESDPVLNFKVYNAIGGKVVEFRYYDRTKDRNHNQTYIITNDQDFGDRTKIATMENLKA